MNENGFSGSWVEARLGTVTATGAPIGYGIVQPGPHVQDGIPMIAVRDLTEIMLRRLHRTSILVEANYKRSRVEPGDVLISVKGTTGRIGIVPLNVAGNISRDVARIRLGVGQDPEFWLQLLRSSNAQKTLQQSGVGSTRQELSIGNLRKLSFSHPQLSEQHAIAGALKDADRQVSAIERLISKKRSFKRGLMQELLTGQTRLPGSNGRWQAFSISDLATIVKGQQLGRAEMNANGGVEVWNGGIEPSGFTDVSNTFHTVVTISEGGNSCGWVGQPQSGFWLGGHCYALTPKWLGLPVQFLYQALKLREPDLMALRVGSGLPNIQKRALSEFIVRVPLDMNEAGRIGDILKDADTEIAALERRLESGRAVKQGMMQELLTGRTRLLVEVAT